MSLKNQWNVPWLNISNYFPAVYNVASTAWPGQPDHATDKLQYRLVAVPTKTLISSSFKLENYSIKITYFIIFYLNANFIGHFPHIKTRNINSFFGLFFFHLNGWFFIRYGINMGRCICELHWCIITDTQIERKSSEGLKIFVQRQISEIMLLIVVWCNIPRYDIAQKWLNEWNSQGNVVSVSVIFTVLFDRYSGKSTNFRNITILRVSPGWYSPWAALAFDWTRILSEFIKK